ncbi:hypothetical protein OG206_25765 [Streptomyces sp. NBC_01341]|uniref:hypothetical protein n=1 Tax=Streptomyces sp. NBC_01341 TaxID=2903831 RepID=UPI002E0D8CCA|nr:hypothetical protein OG206_25765 [Streptomyces sp. NBC_01341]
MSLLAWWSPKGIVASRGAAAKQPGGGYGQARRGYGQVGGREAVEAARGVPRT